MNAEAVLKKTLELLSRGRTVAIATVVVAKGSVPGKQGAKMLLADDGTIAGTVGGAGLEEKIKGACREALKSGVGGIQHFDLMYYKEGGMDSLCGGSVDIAVEVLVPKPHLLICGGGHVGLEVARLIDQLEYSYSVLDDRAEYVSVARFPNAAFRFESMPEPFFAAEDPSRFSHLLLLGYSHKIDTDILYHACRSFGGWIGVISSRAKKKEMIHRVKARGIRDEQLARVEAPVGLDIGAQTPAEIAVSILGSIIRDVKNPKAVEATVFAKDE